MIQVGRKSVADVDHSAGQLLLTQQQSPADTRIGTNLPQQQTLERMFFQTVWTVCGVDSHTAFNQTQARSGVAEKSCYKYLIAGRRAASHNRAAEIAFANQN